MMKWAANIFSLNESYWNTFFKEKSVIRIKIKYFVVFSNVTTQLRIMHTNVYTCVIQRTNVKHGENSRISNSIHWKKKMIYARAKAKHWPPRAHYNSTRVQSLNSMSTVIVGMRKISDTHFRPTSGESAR